MVSEPAAEAGIRLRQSLEELLQRLPEQANPKLVEGVSKCFGRGHPLPEDASMKSTVRLMEDFVQQLHEDPSRRQFVVDHDSLDTDDAAWLTLAGLAPTEGALQWSITTIRSLERSVYDQCYANGWNIQHSTGPRGSAVVTKRLTSLNEEGCHQAFFSDTPKFVVATAGQLGVLYPDHLVIRVLRTAPRVSLTQGLTRVLHNQPNLTNNVFTLWIRHHEKIDDLPGLGQYKYGIIQSQNTDVSLLDLLTAIEEDGEHSETIASPVAHDFVLASQASLQRCNPAKISTTSSQASGTNAFTFDSMHKSSGVPVEASIASESLTPKESATDEFAWLPESTTPATVGEEKIYAEEEKKEVEDVSDIFIGNQATPCPTQKKAFYGDQERHPLFSNAPSPQPLTTAPLNSAIPYSVSTIDTNQVEQDDAVDSVAPYSVSTINTYEVEREGELEIRPSFSFDEEDASPQVEKPEGDAAPDVALEEENGVELKEDGQEIKTQTSNSVPSDVEGMVAEVEQVANDDELPPNQITKPGMTLVFCVGCGTNKTKSEFSKNQLRKKKNARCTDCVRDNRLGTSNK